MAASAMASLPFMSTFSAIELPFNRDGHIGAHGRAGGATGTLVLVGAMGRVIALGRDDVRVELENAHRADIGAQPASLAEEIVDSDSRHGNLPCLLARGPRRPRLSLILNGPPLGPGRLDVHVHSIAIGNVVQGAWPRVSR